MAMTARRSMVDEYRTRFSEERSAKARAAEGSRFESVGLGKAPVSAWLSPACQPKEGEPAMKRSVVALGILGLVCAVALPAANAAVLYQDDFSSGKVKGVNGVYIQAIDNLTVADPANTAISTGHFKVQTDPTMTRNFGWLDGGDSGGIAESPGNDTDGTSAIA